MANRQKAYFGLDFIISLILHIIGLGWILGTIVRIQRQNWLGAILCFIFYPVFWVIDLITLIMHKDLTVLA